MRRRLCIAIATAIAGLSTTVPAATAATEVGWPCVANEDGAVSVLHEGSVGLGETRVFKAESDVGTPVTALVEPDADGDGYGDETQDGCPQSAATATECPPPVDLDVTAKARKRSILLSVRADAEASVDVYGQVGWNFKPRRKARGEDRRAHAARKRGVKRLIVGLDGGTKRVAPGAATRFTIRLPKQVRLRLSRLTRRESVRAKLTLRATSVVGLTKNTRLRVKLRGWRRSR